MLPKIILSGLMKKRKKNSKVKSLPIKHTETLIDLDFKMNKLQRMKVIAIFSYLFKKKFF